jgi:hypothetical protein
MITELTPAQIARFPEFVEKWTKIGLDTAPADRGRAESAIRLMYGRAKLIPPKIVWCGSPLGNALVRACIGEIENNIGESVPASVRSSIWESVSENVHTDVWNSAQKNVRVNVEANINDNVDASIWNSVRASIEDGVWESVWESVQDNIQARISTGVQKSVGKSVRGSIRTSVGKSVRDNVSAYVYGRALDSVRDNVAKNIRDDVWANVCGSIRANVWDSVRANVLGSVRTSIEATIDASTSIKKSVNTSVWASIYGQHDASWLEFYDFFQTACGLRDQVSPLDGIMELAKSANWALPFKDICWISERHNFLTRDDAGRLHSVTGPALTYPDGWSIYAVHGTLVPESWIGPGSTLDSATALAESNVEKRRAACEILGWNRILAELNTTTIDLDLDPSIGELVEIDHPQIGKERFLKVVCGTGRIFALPVPHDMPTALAANAWTYGLTADDYNPEVRT